MLYFMLIMCYTCYIEFNERGVNMTTDYERLYYYEQLDNNGNITIRLPQQLKDDFIKCSGGSRQMGRVLREFMVNYISERQNQKE